MATPISLWRPPAGQRIDPTAIDATGATLGDALSAQSDGTGGQRAGYAATSGGVTSWKQAVRVATTAAGTLASSFENGDTVDGVTLATGDRILIKNQASGAENGIYTVNASGAPTRATDADSGAELVGAAVVVTEGTTNADTQWVCTTNAPITLGSTSLAFATVSGSSSGVQVRKNSAGSTFTRPRINLIEGTGVTLTVADDSTDNEVDVTINASTGGSTPAWVANNPRTPPASPNAADREFKPGDTYDGTTLGSPATAPTILTAGGLLVTSGTSGGADQKGAAYTLPGGWVSVTTKVTLCKGRRFMVSGLHLRNSSTAKTRGVEIFLNTDDNFRDYWLESPTYTGLTTRTAAGTQWNYHKPEAFLRWRVSGSNIIGELSASGREGDWVTLVNEAASSHFSGGNLPDQAFLVIDMFSTVAGAAIFDFIRFT